MIPDPIALADKINFAILMATVIAILVGPIVAVYLTRRIDSRNEARRRRLEVYRNLMLTRTARLAPDHVRALNLVPVNFANVSAVIDPFRKYIDHLNSPLPAVDQQDHYFAQRSDIFYELLFQIGKALGYSFDKRDLERLSYIPRGYVNDKNRQRRMQELLTQILEGTRTFPVSIGQPAGPTNPFPPPP